MPFAAVAALARLIPLLARVGGGLLRGGGRVAGKMGATKTGSRLLRRGYAAGRRAAPRGSKARSFFKGAGRAAKAAGASAPAQSSIADAVQMATSSLGGGRGGGDPDRDIDFGQGSSGTSTSTQASGGGGSPRVEKQTTIKERIIERVKGAFGGGKKDGYDPKKALAEMSDRKREIRRQQIIEENTGELSTMSSDEQDQFISEKEDEADQDYITSSQERADAAEKAGSKITDMTKKVSKYAAVVVGVTAATYGAGEALKHFGQYLVKANEHLKEYSGVIASSMAEYRMHTRLMEMKRAQDMGGVISEYTQSQMEFEKAMQPIENVIDAAVMNITETIMDMASVPINWLTNTGPWKWIERWVGVGDNPKPTSEILKFWNEQAKQGDVDRWVD